MALTIDEQPNQIAPAYNENIWKVISDRDDPISEAVGVVSDDGGGFTEYTISSGPGHGILVGDILTGSGFSESTYNVIQTVTGVSGSNVITDVVFVANDSGTLTRNNNGFQVLAQIIEFGINSTKSITSIADAGGGQIDITTSTAHGLAIDDIIVVTGTTSYNTVSEVKAVPSTTVVTVDRATFFGTETGTLEKGEIRGSKTAKISIAGVKYVFDFSNILSSIVNKDGFDLIALGSTTIQTPTDNSIRSYGVLFTEQFEDADGLIKNEDQTQTNAVKKTINIARQLGEALDLAEFLTNATTRRFLTSSTSPKDIQDSQEEQLSFIADDGETYKIRSERFDANGASLGVTTSASEAISNNRGIVPVNNNLWDAGTDTVDVWLVDVGDVQVSEKRKFKVERNCFRNKVEIYFLNRSGGHDLYTFTGDLIESIETSKTKFKKVIAEGFDIEDRQQTTLGVQGNDRTEIFSQFLTRAEGVWLSQYVSSPEVVLLDSSKFVPIDPQNKKEVIDRDRGMTQIKATFIKPDLIIQTN